MDWQDQYMPGSFRGVGFVTQSHGHDFGRRGESHDYPFRDVPWFEDLGRKGRAWALTAFVIGDDYMAKRDALIAALEAPGPGTLVHPFLGSFQAQVAGCHVSESTEDGGMARFELAFVEPGISVAAVAKPDTLAAAKAVAKKVKTSALARFIKAYVTYAEPAFLILRSGATLSSLGAAVGLASSALGGSGAGLSSLTGALATLDDAVSLVGEASALGNAMMVAVGALGNLGSSPPAQIAALTGLVATVVAMPAGSGTTAARVQLAANNQASADLTVAAVAVALANTVPTISFVSYDDAAALRQTLSDMLDGQSAAANDRGNLALAYDLDHLRRVIVADITARGGSLAPLFSYTPVSVRPAVSIAWSVYGDAANVLAQEDDILARNGIMHPLFVPVASLQLLSAQSLSGGGANG